MPKKGIDAVRLSGVEVMLTPREAAYVLGMSEGKLATWRANKEGPKYCKIGRNVRYRPQDIYDFRDQYFVTK